MRRQAASTLDAKPVQVGDRKAAEDEYMQLVLEFNDQIDVLRREHEAKMLAIEARQKRNEGHAETLQKELIVAFNELEKVVDGGIHPFARSKIGKLRSVRLMLSG